LRAGRAVVVADDAGRAIAADLGGSFSFQFATTKPVISAVVTITARPTVTTFHGLQRPASMGCLLSVSIGIILLAGQIRVCHGISSARSC
jgi:hypothetical protein